MLTFRVGEMKLDLQPSHPRHEVCITGTARRLKISFSQWTARRFGSHQNARCRQVASEVIWKEAPAKSFDDRNKHATSIIQHPATQSQYLLLSVKKGVIPHASSS